MKFILIAFIKAYQKTLSPLIGSNCRFNPSCSHYSIQALQTHGAIKGTWLTIKRLCRCHPWGGYGYNPVPDKDKPSQ